MEDFAIDNLRSSGLFNFGVIMGLIGSLLQGISHALTMNDFSIDTNSLGIKTGGCCLLLSCICFPLMKLNSKPLNLDQDSMLLILIGVFTCATYFNVQKRNDIFVNRRTRYLVIIPIMLMITWDWF